LAALLLPAPAGPSRVTIMVLLIACRSFSGGSQTRAGLRPTAKLQGCGWTQTVKILSAATVRVTIGVTPRISYVKEPAAMGSLRRRSPGCKGYERRLLMTTETGCE